MPDNPPIGPDPGPDDRVASADEPTTAGGTPPGRRIGWVRRLRPSESVLFAAMGLVVGVVATLLVVRGSGPGAPVRAAGGPPAQAVTSPGTTSGAGPTGHRHAPVAARTIPPAAKPDPAQIGLVHIRPVAVSIPAIKVSSPLVDLGLNADGSLQVPTDFAKAGWYSGGPYPGDADGPPAIIAGHIDNYHGPAIFYRLRHLHAGDRVYVRRADGSTATFVVYRTGDYLKSQFPASSIYEPNRAPELRLITCTGQFDDKAGSYLSDFVAFARLASPGTRR